MPAKKSTKSVARKSARKSAKKASARRTAIVDNTATLSPYGRSVLRVFRDGVQQAYARMASAGVAATVVVDGKVVRGVPHREEGRFVVSEPALKQMSARRAK